MPMRLSRTYAYTLLLSLLLTGASAQAGVYQWTDADGEVHYSDRIPPEKSGLGHKVLTGDGRVVEEVEGQKDADELRREQERAARQAEQERQRRRQEQYDRSLLITYADASQIDKLRDERIRLVDATIRLTRAKIDKIASRLEAAENRKIHFLTRQRKPPKQLLANIAEYEKQLANYHQQIRFHEQRKRQIEEKFSRDKTRFLELQASRASRNETASQ